MTDIRELLDGIEKRAPKAMDEFSAVTDEADSPELWRLLMDTAHMHAALRAVLDLHEASLDSYPSVCAECVEYLNAELTSLRRSLMDERDREGCE